MGRCELVTADPESAERDDHDQSIRSSGRGARERGCGADLRGAGGGEPRRGRGAAALEDRARADPARAVGGVHGRDLRPADGQARGVHQHAGAGCLEPRHRGGLRASGCDADDPAHRAEGDHVEPAGAVPGRRHGGDDAAAHQDGAPDREPGHHPQRGARGLPGRHGGAAGAGASGAARGHRRRRGARGGADPAAPDRAAGGAPGGPRPGGRDDPGGQAPLGDAGGGHEPAAAGRGPHRLHPPHPAALLQHPDGQGHGGRRAQSLHGHGRPLRARLCPRGDRQGRPHPLDRSRHDREAALHHGASRDPR